ncbi:hypothetical protein AB0F57_38070 [Streptomyces tanashiensis]|uniref:hypothetical protein n=1 Tax=Streptomyces tanashiensis TaxID=67367 RepID=UPI0033E6947D
MHTPTRPALLLTTALALGLALPQPAAAHGHNLDIVITGHQGGHILTKVTWENDGDAVDQPVAALVNAVSTDGRRTAGPWKLVRGTRPTDWTTTEALPAGTWNITVDAGQPALGHAEQQLTVTTAPSYPGTPSAPDTDTSAHTPVPAQDTSPVTDATRSPRPPSTSPSTPQDHDQQTWGPGPTTAALAAASLLGTAAGIWIRHRRKERH